MVLSASPMRITEPPARRQRTDDSTAPTRLFDAPPPFDPACRWEKCDAQQLQVALADLRADADAREAKLVAVGGAIERLKRSFAYQPGADAAHGQLEADYRALQRCKGVHELLDCTEATLETHARM